jgi:hypothetical protein
MTEQYAQALWNLSQKKGADAKALVAHLVKDLKQSGRLKLLPQILVALKKLEAQQAKVVSVVEVASESEAKHALHEAAAKGIHAEHAVVNESLISGWRAIGKVEGKEKLIDASSKRALLEIYQAVTH